jgi:hypothetical protein
MSCFFFNCHIEIQIFIPTTETCFSDQDEQKRPKGCSRALILVHESDSSVHCGKGSSVWALAQAGGGFLALCPP